MCKEIRGIQSFLSLRQKMNWRGEWKHIYHFWVAAGNLVKLFLNTSCRIILNVCGFLLNVVLSEAGA